MRRTSLKNTKVPLTRLCREFAFCFRAFSNVMLLGLCDRALLGGVSVAAYLAHSFSIVHRLQCPSHIA
jgi:hypothetical protein